MKNIAYAFPRGARHTITPNAATLTPGVILRNTDDPSFCLEFMTGFNCLLDEYFHLNRKVYPDVIVSAGSHQFKFIRERNRIVYFLN